MKSTIVLICICCSYLQVQAQLYPLGQGALRSGGGFNFSQQDDPEGHIYRFSVNPNIGYFLTDHWMVGFNSNFTGQIAPDQFTSNLRFSPQVRYYVPLNKSVFLIGDAFYNVNREKKDSKGVIKIEDQSSYAFGPGIDYFLTRRISCEGVFLMTRYVRPDYQHLNKVSVQFGFHVRLPIKKKDRLPESLQSMEEVAPVYIIDPSSIPQENTQNKAH